MSVILLSHTPEPEKVVASAAKTCYAPGTIEELTGTITDESAEKFIRRLMKMGHESPLEHATFTFAVENVSRSLLAQITRHRIASFSVSSQRYVKAGSFTSVVPEAIKGNVHARRVFDHSVERAAEDYRAIHDYLMSEYLLNLYGTEIPCDNPRYFHLSVASHFNSKDGEEKKRFNKDFTAAEKYANENARAVLPNATATQFVVTMNARELRHFFSLRCCNRAQQEIRELAEEMLALCKQAAPALFEGCGAPCVSGPCPEGAMSCGHPKTDAQTIGGAL